MNATYNQAATGREQNFRSILQDLARTRSSIVSVFADFCRITACCLAMQTREDEYLQAVKGYTKDELNQLAQAMGMLIHEMDAKPFEDVIGTYYTEINSVATQNARGEFYTPPAVSEMMAKMTLDIEQIKADAKPFTLSDPACGSGGIILACGKSLGPEHVHLMRATLQDISPVACDMAYINTTLWSIPAEIILGNTLKAEWISRWANLHWHRVGEESRRRSLRLLGLVRELENTAPPQPRPPPEKQDAGTPPSAGPHEQLNLF